VSGDYHKPTKFSSGKFEEFVGGDDPAQLSRAAHETAHALLNRVRESEDEALVERVITFTDSQGIDAIAELWSRSSAQSLPGALWRIYLMRTLIRQDATGTSQLYQRGIDVTATIDAVVAGARTPTGPEEILDLSDQILRGLFTGDFAVALDRAAAFSRVTAAGAVDVANDSEPTEPERARQLTIKASRLADMAVEFASAGRLWRAGRLD
jgi:hypothetical protein